MKLYATAFLTLLLSISVSAFSTNPIVRGKVFDKHSHEPLSGVNVIYGKNLGTTTGNNGFFQFSSVSVKQEITFKFIGYQSVTKTLFLEQNDTVFLNIGLIPTENKLDEIVISANKAEQRIADLTISMSVIKPNVILKNHLTKAEEIINQSPGVEIMDGQASIRGGSGYSYGAGSRVLALIDGLPALSSDAGNIRWQFLPIENLSQIEIIKGASSVLYGSSALNGVINFRTSDAGIKPITRFSVLSGVYDNPRQINWKWWDSPRMFSNISFSHLQRFGNTDIGFSSNLLYNNNYRKLNDEKLARINLKIKQRSKKFSNLSYGLNLNGGYNIKQDFILWEDADSGALKQDEATAIELNGIFYTIDPFISLRNEKYRHDLRMRLLSSQNKYPDNKQNNSDALSYYAEYQLFYKIIENLDIIIGASQLSSRIVSNFYGDHNGLNIAGYSQLNYRPFDKLKLVTGMRLEYNALDSKSDKLIPIFRTGVNYHAADYTFLRASFGQGYRYPSIAEKYASTTLGSVKIFPNPEIKPESGWSSEIGIKQGVSFWDLTGQFDLALFYSQNQDMIEYIFGLFPDPVTGIIEFGFKATNIENSRVYGFETEMLLNKNFAGLNATITGGYTFIYPVEFDPNTFKNTDTYLKYRSKHSLKLILSTSYKKLELGLNTFYKSEILNIDNVFLNPLTRESLLPGFYDYWIENSNGYIVFDGNIAFKLNTKLKLSFSVKNITNTEYMGRPGDIRPHRNYSLQFSGKF